ENYRKHFDDFSFSRALENVWELIARVNKYIVENEPWAIAEKPSEAKKLDSVLFHAAESLRLIAALLAPVVPKTAQNLWEQLGLENKVSGIRLGEIRWTQELAERTIRGGSSLFPRLDPKEVLKKMDSIVERKTDSNVEKPENLPATNVAPQITIDDFSK